MDDELEANLAALEELLPTAVVGAYLREHPEDRDLFVREVSEQREGWTDVVRAIEGRAMDWRDRHMRSVGDTQH